jgi:Viral BACON domain
LAQDGQEGTYAYAAATIDADATDGIISADWWPAASGYASAHPIGGILFRGDLAHGNFWVAGSGFFGLGLSLWKVTNWSWALNATSSVPVVPGWPHHVEVHLAGPSIEVWWDGVRELQAMDGMGGASSVHGLYTWTNWDWVSTFDNFSIVGSRRCVSPVSPQNVIASETGQTGTLTVSAAPSCEWQAFTDVPWISAAPASGASSGTIAYTVAQNSTAPNSVGTIRSGTIVIGGRGVVVTQPPMPDPCFLSIFPNGTTFPADGGQGRFPVTVAMSQCEWMESTSASWLTPTTTLHIGSGWAGYAVDRNDTGSTRSGVVYVKGSAFVVTQTADFAGSPRVDDPGCFNGVFPNGATFAGDGGTGTITVSAPSGCGWVASSDAAWVSLHATSGAGDTILEYIVAQNPTNSTRTASVSVGNATFVVAQLNGTVPTGGGPGPSCYVAANVDYVHAQPSGGAGLIQIVTPAGCSWSLQTDSDWIHVSTTAGSGAANVLIAVDQQSTVATRVGHISVGSITVPVVQSVDWTPVYQMSGAPKVIGRFPKYGQDRDDPEPQESSGEPCVDDPNCGPGIDIVITLPGEPSGGGGGSPPTISGSHDVWWFQGQTPINYPTTIALNSSAGNYTVWSIVSGSAKVRLSNTLGASTTVIPLGSVMSSSHGDIKITATYNNVSSSDFAISLRTPRYAVFVDRTTDRDETFGYISHVSYRIYDQLDDSLPAAVVPVNEQWVSGVVNDYRGTNWRQGIENGGAISTGGAVNGIFNDEIGGENLSYRDSNGNPPIPTPVANHASVSDVQHWGQAFFIGGNTAGLGVRIQTDVLQKRVGTGLHTFVVSPPQ